MLTNPHDQLWEGDRDIHAGHVAAAPASTSNSHTAATNCNKVELTQQLGHGGDGDGGGVELREHKRAQW